MPACSWNCTTIPIGASFPIKPVLLSVLSTPLPCTKCPDLRRTQAQNAQMHGHSAMLLHSSTSWCRLPDTSHKAKDCIFLLGLKSHVFNSSVMPPPPPSIILLLPHSLCVLWSATWACGHQLCYQLWPSIVCHQLWPSPVCHQLGAINCGHHLCYQLWPSIVCHQLWPPPVCHQLWPSPVCHQLWPSTVLSTVAIKCAIQVVIGIEEVIN